MEDGSFHKDREHTHPSLEGYLDPALVGNKPQWGGDQVLITIVCSICLNTKCLPSYFLKCQNLEGKRVKFLNSMDEINHEVGSSRGKERQGRDSHHSQLGSYQ